jgi:hypothetical protein
MILNARSGICGVRLLRRLKVPEINLLPIVFDLSHPSLIAHNPTDSLKPGLIVRLRASIPHVLGLRGKAEIGSPVVQPVPVDVVYLHIGRRIQDKAMHQKHPFLSRNALKIGHSVAYAKQAPVLVFDQRDVGCVNNGFAPLC